MTHINNKCVLMVVFTWINLLLPSVESTTIQDAIANAGVGGTARLDSTTYSGGGNCNIVVSSNVELAGASNVYPDLKNIWSIETIPDTTVANCSPKFMEVNNAAVITLSNFAVVQCGGTNANAGAILVDQSTLVLQNMIFYRNSVIDGSYGGAIYITGPGSSSLNAINTLFSLNMAVGGKGAAIYASKAGSIKLQGCIFQQNSGGYGGTIYAEQTELVLMNGCDSSQNIASDTAAVLSAQKSTTVVVIRSNFEDNTANYGGAMSIEESSFLTIRNSSFSQNTASKDGGAIWAMGKHNFSPTRSQEPYIDIKNSSFTGNYARYGGFLYSRGGVELGYGMRITIESSTIQKNSCWADGGVFLLCQNNYLSINNTSLNNNALKNKLSRGAIWKSEVCHKGGSGPNDALVTIRIKNSRLHYNYAFYLAAIGINYLTNTLNIFENSSFDYNTGNNPDVWLFWFYRPTTLVANNCSFNNNNVGAFFLKGTKAIFTNCTIDNNKYRAIAAMKLSSVLLQDTSISHNTAKVHDFIPSDISSTSQQPYGGLAVSLLTASSLKLRNALISHNVAVAILDNCAGGALSVGVGCSMQIEAGTRIIGNSLYGNNAKGGAVAMMASKSCVQIIISYNLNFRPGFDVQQFFWKTMPSSQISRPLGTTSTSGTESFCIVPNTFVFQTDMDKVGQFIGPGTFIHIEAYGKVLMHLAYNSPKMIKDNLNYYWWQFTIEISRGMAGVYINGEDILFKDNYVSGDGGAIAATFDDNILTISNLSTVTFSNNTAERHGGAICLMSSTAFLLGRDDKITGKSILFERNCALSGNGGAIASLRGLFILPPTSILDTIKGVENSAGGNGGFIYATDVGLGAYLFKINNINVLSSKSSGNGGALYIASSKLVIKDLQVSFSHSMGDGGALMFVETDVSLENVIIHKSSSKGDGGGLKCVASKTTVLKISNSVLKSNNALLNGGAISSKFCELYLPNVSLSNNVAQQSGGGIHLGFRGSLITTNKVVISGNKAKSGGGAISCQSCFSLQLQNQTAFQRNIVYGDSGKGGAIYVDTSDYIISNGSLFYKNEASFGGGVAVENCNTGFQSTFDRFEQNIAQHNGGAMWLSNTYGNSQSWFFRYFYCRKNMIKSKDGSGTCLFWQPSPDSTHDKLNWHHFAEKSKIRLKGSNTNIPLSKEIVATSPYRMYMPTAINIPKDGMSQISFDIMALPNSLIQPPLEVVLLDWYNETAVGIQGSVVKVVSNCTIIKPEKFFSGGKAIFSDLRIKESQGEICKLSIATSLVSQKLVVHAHIGLCKAGNRAIDGDCIPCRPGSFSFRGSESCTECIKHAVCDSGIVSIPDGYWYAPPDIQLSKNSRVFKCRHSSACKTLNNTKVLCSKGYEGNLCASCSSGYTETGKYGCAACPKNSVLNDFVMVFGFIVVTLVATFIVRKTISSGNERAYYKNLVADMQNKVNATEVIIYSVDHKSNFLRPQYLVRVNENQDNNINSDINCVQCDVNDTINFASDHRLQEVLKTSALYTLPLSQSTFICYCPVISDIGEILAILKVTLNKKGSLERQKKVVESTANEHSALVQGANKDIVSMSAKVFASYFQFVSLARNMQIRWTSMLLTMFDIQSSTGRVDPKMFSLDCALRGSGKKAEQTLFFEKYFFLLLLPIFFFVVCLFVWCGQYCYRVHVSPGHWLPEGGVWTENRLKKLKSNKLNNFIVSLIVLLFLIQPTISAWTLKIFNCVELGEGKFWLHDSLSVSCESDQYYFWAFGMGVLSMIVYVAGIPAMAFFVLWRNRFKFHEPEVRSRYGFLLNGYNVDRAWFWETVVMSRKILVAMIAVYGGYFGSYIQSLLAILVVLICIVLHIHYRPYEFKILHDLEKWSLIVTFVTFYLGAYLVEDTLEVKDRMALSIIIVMSNIAFVSYSIYTLRQYVKQKLNAVRTRLSRSNSDNLKTDISIKDKCINFCNKCRYKANKVRIIGKKRKMSSVEMRQSFNETNEYQELL